MRPQCAAALIALAGLTNCATNPPPSARELPGGPQAYRHVAVMPSATTDVAVRLRQTVAGIPDGDMMMALCAAPGIEADQVRNQAVAEGGAVSFDAGLVVRSQLAPQPGVSTFIRAPNGLAAHVCGQDLETTDAPLPD